MKFETYKHRTLYIKLIRNLLITMFHSQRSVVWLQYAALSEIYISKKLSSRFVYPVKIIPLQKV